MSRARPAPLLLPVLVAGALCAVLWLLLGSGSGEGSDAPPGLRDATAGAEPGAASADPDLTSRPGARTRAEIEAERAAAHAPTATFSRSESVYGFVLDGRQKPVAGARVKLIAVPLTELLPWGVPDPEPVAVATTGEDGAYRVGPAPDGPLKVRAEAAGFAPTVEAVARRGTRIDLILDRGGSLDVSVQDPTGALVAGAKVIHTAGTLVTLLETDAEGKARFDSVPTGQGALLVLKEGLGAARVNDASVAPGEDRHVSVILSRPIAVRGRVTDAEDRPVPGAAVTIRFPNLPSLPPVSLVAGEDGTFRQEVSGTVNETFELAAEHPEKGTGKVWSSLQDSGGGSMEAVVKLGSGLAPLVGRVQGPDGRGAEGVLVTYGNQGNSRAQPEARSGHDGEFEIALPPGAQPNWGLFLVAVSDTQGVGGAQVQLNDKAGTARPPVTITLSGSGRVEGRVVDAAGAGVDGAVVALATDWSVRSSRAGPTNWMLVQILQDPRRFRLNALTDAEGRYSIPNVPAASFRVSATYGLAQGVLPEAVAVPAGGATTADLVLGEGGTIEGTVVDDQGQGVAGAWVQAFLRQRRAEGMWFGGRNVTARSQSDGSFVLRGVTSEGAWSVQAWAAGYQSKPTPDVSAGTKGVEVRLTALGWIQGVLTEGGRPYRGTFSVSVVPAPDEGASTPQNDMRWQGNNPSAFNTDDGRFLVRGIAAGTWLVSATTPDGGITVQTERVQVLNGQASRDVTLVLGRGAVLSGTVTNGESGRPVANAHVWVNLRQGRGGAGQSSGGQTDAAGRFVVRGLAPGAYTVYVNPPSGVGWQEDLELREGETREVSLVERVPGKILVHVVDPEGRGVARATPQVRTAAGNLLWPSWQALQNEGLLDSRTGDGWDRMLRTDASGDNLRHHVAPGRYQVTAQLEGWVAQGEAPWVEVQARRTTEVTVVLRPQ